MLEAPRFARAARRRRSTSTAPCGCARRTPPGGSTASAWAATHAAGARRSDCTASQFRTRRDKLTYPVPAHAELLPPRPGAARAAARGATARTCSTRWRWAWATTSRRTRAFKAIGIALSGGRDSLLTLLIAHRYATRARPDDAGLAAARLLHAHPLLLGRDPRGRARPSARRARRTVPGGPHRRGVRARARGGESRCSAGRAADRRSPSRTSRRGCAASGCGTGPTRAAGCSCRRGT